MTQKPFPSSVYILAIDSTQASLAEAGGKGANLARLAQAGFPVPDGFILTTGAYQEFVSFNGLEAPIRTILANGQLDDPVSLEDISTQIRERFSIGGMPARLADELRAAYAHLGSPPVAVRSSATAEDLPEMSFAGQQDTFLNVTNPENLLTAVVACWSSLWTARAIGYRERSVLGQSGWRLAVVVQEMVASDVSGVLFTANPLTGLRSETVIDAAFGLGEPLVSGELEPDHFVLDSISGEIHSQVLGTKQAAAYSKLGGGIERIALDGKTRLTLSEGQIKQLAAAGQQIQQEFGAPQDIEWALARGKMYILQSRPVTSLFPLPQESLDPLITWFSFGAVQGVAGPMTPLGRDAILKVVVGAGRLFGVTFKDQRSDLMVEAGERIWIKVSDLLRNPLGSRIFGLFLRFIEPSVGQILGVLTDDPRLGAGKGRFKFSTLRRMLRFFLPAAAGALLTMLNPQKARARFEASLESYLSTVQIDPGCNRFERLANLVAYMQAGERMAFALPFALPRFLPIFAPAMGMMYFLIHFSGDEFAALSVTRGLPDNVTTQMDLALWRAAAAIRANAEAQAVFCSSDAESLAQNYLAGRLPPAAQAAIKGFMDQYGMRGVGEIDIGQPRWREAPAPVMHTLQSYLQIDPAAAPDVQFKRSEQAAQAAVEQLAAQARRQPGGWLKQKMVRGAARRLRALMGARESPKFFAVRSMGIVRQALLETGQEFTSAGTLVRPDDLAFLNIAELNELAHTNQQSTAPEMDWKGLIAERRALYARELRRRQVPRVLVSDGRTFYAGIGAASDSRTALRGSPVSPGVVEGVVCVVLDPRSTSLVPGEIMVCPGTDPAWTPLFLAASGLITEVGGMMTHGSVVAREYGIPAVVGVDNATQRLRSGQRIRLNGTTGEVTLLENEAAEPVGTVQLEPVLLSGRISESSSKSTGG